MRVYVLDSEAQTSNHYIALAIRDALARHPDVEIATLGDYGSAVDEFRAGGYDVFVCFGGARSQASLQAQLSAMARVSVLWTTEDPYELTSNVAQSRHYDVVFTNDLASLPAYRGRARHLPLAAAMNFNNIPVIEDDSKYQYDIFFVGTAWPNRVVTINKIIRLFGSTKRLKIGLPYNKYIKRPDLVDPDLLVNWRCSNLEFARLSNTSRIVLSLQRRFTGSTDGVTAGSTPPPRLFEVGLSGGVQVFGSNSEEAKRYYKDGEEFLFCGSDDQLISAIRGALADPARRIAMAQAARQRTLKEHTYERRVDRIVEAVRSAKPRQPVRRKTRTVLIVTHNILSDRPGGGVEIYQEQIKYMNIYQRVMFLYPAPGGRVFRLVDSSRVEDFDLEEPFSEGEISHGKAEEILTEILVKENVDLVHFQHLIGMPLSLPLIVKAYGVPAIYTYHDHFLICSQYTLLGFDDRFCNTAEKSLALCDVCLHAKSQIAYGSQGRRRAFIARVLEALDAVVASTRFSADYLSAVYGLRPEKLRVIEMMMPPALPPKLARKAKLFDAGSTEPLRVAIPGNFTTPKGGNQLLRAFNVLRHDNIEFTVLGRVDAPFDSILKSLNLPKVTVLGGYKQSEVLERMLEFDVSLHLAIWPETYVIALSEAWTAGLIPIVTDLGAQGERVTHEVDGLKIPVNDIGAIIDVLRGVRCGAFDLEAMRAEIAKKSLPGPTQHLAQLSELYDELIASKPLAEIAPAIKAKLPFEIMGFLGGGVRTNSRRWSSAAIEWDESIQDTPPPFKPNVLRAFPPHYRHLPQEIETLGKTKDLRLHFDDIVVDGKEVKPEETLVVNAFHSATVAGWISLNSKYPFVEMYVELTSAAGKAFVLVNSIPRPDVEKKFENRRFVRGFQTSLPLSALDDETYDLRFHLVFDGQVVVVEGGGRVTLGRGAEQDEGWSADAADFLGDKPVADIASGAVLLAPKTYADFVEGNIFAISGWTNPPAGYGAAHRLALAIRDKDGRILLWTEVEPCLRPSVAEPVDQMLAFTGFTAKAPTPRLPPSSYKFSVLQDLGDRIGVSDVLVLPREIHAAAGERGFQARIDEIKESEDGRELFIAGWMFLVGHGAPRDVFVRWLDKDGGVRTLAARRHTRADVEDALRNEHARFAGFRLTIDRSLLRATKVALCQVYADAIVVFDNFSELAANARNAPTAAAPRAGVDKRKASAPSAESAPIAAPVVTLPPALKDVRVAAGDAGFYVRIDDIAQIKDGADPKVSLSGWMFVAGRGTPRDVFIRWLDDSKAMRTLGGRRQHRPDVGAALGNEDANGAGFRIEMDRSVFLNKKVALCQVYSDAITVFGEFGDLAKATLAYAGTDAANAVADAAEAVPSAPPAESGDVRVEGATAPREADAAGVPETTQALAALTDGQPSAARVETLAPEVKDVAVTAGDPGFYIRVDAIAEQDGGPDPKLSIDGWMFLAGRGEPRDVFVRVLDDTGVSQTLIARRQNRPDVGTALADDDANGAGYRIEIGRSLLLNSKAALCQVYADATVVFHDFGGLIKSSMLHVTGDANPPP